MPKEAEQRRQGRLEHGTGVETQGSFTEGSSLLAEDVGKKVALQSYPSPVSSAEKY